MGFSVAAGAFWHFFAASIACDVRHYEGGKGPGSQAELREGRGRGADEGRSSPKRSTPNLQPQTASSRLILYLQFAKRRIFSISRYRHIFEQRIEPPGVNNIAAVHWWWKFLTRCCQMHEIDRSWIGRPLCPRAFSQARIANPWTVMMFTKKQRGRQPKVEPS